MHAHGGKEAAVLVPIADWHGTPGVILTERRDDLKSHAGEISFPGGRRDGPHESLERTALREAEEEIGLDPADVQVVGALPPVGTFVTSYRIQPFVGMVSEGASVFPNPDEVALILRFSLDDLSGAYAMRRLVRRGVPVRTPTFEMDRHLIWGATARILSELLARLGRI